VVTQRSWYPRNKAAQMRFEMLSDLPECNNLEENIVRNGVGLKLSDVQHLCFYADGLVQSREVMRNSRMIYARQFYSHREIKLLRVTISNLENYF
jgi:hypothetical protein